MGRFARRFVSMLSGLIPALFLLSLTVETSVAGIGPVPLNVESSDTEQVTLSISELEADWRLINLRNGQIQVYEVNVPGFINQGEPRRPVLPRAGGWLVVPPGTRPELRVVSETWQDAGLKPLMVGPTPIMIDDSDAEFSSLSEILILPDEDIPEGLNISPATLLALQQPRQMRQGAAVELGNPTMWRGRRIVPIRVVPVLHDADGRATGVLSSGTWQVRFVPDKQAGKAFLPKHGSAKTSPRGDANFSRIFLNSEQLESLPTEAAWQGYSPDPDKGILNEKRGGRSGTLLGPESRIAVRESGLLRVQYSRLVDRGLLPSGPIAEDQIRLYQRRYLPELDDGTGAPFYEVEVPIYMVGEGDNFDGDDFFYFYGLRLRDDVAYTQAEAPFLDLPGSGDNFENRNEYNWYRLAASEPQSGQAWARMREQALPAAQGSPRASYRRHEHHEKQSAFREFTKTNREDVYYSNTRVAAEVTTAIDPLWSPVLDGTDVQVDVKLALWQAANRPIVTLSLIVDSETETELETYNFASGDMAGVVRSNRVPASTLDGARAVVRMGNTSNRLASYLDWVEIQYDAQYKALYGRLAFNSGQESGVQDLDVTGFNSQDLGLLDITDPRKPVIINLSTENVLADGATWKMSFSVNQTQQREFFAVDNFSTTGVYEFAYQLAETLNDPIDPTELDGPAPDMIVISHPQFMDATQRWIDHRKARSGGDLVVHMVNVDDLYKWYSGGLRDPWAIKRFTNHALNVWGTWSMVIVGDANENAREIGVTEVTNGWSQDWVPTHYHVQYETGYPPELLASDKWFATSGSGTNYPEDSYPTYAFSPTDMYVGRFPCNSVGELNNIIDKIIVMETVGPGQTWRKRGIFMADDRWSTPYSGDQTWLEYKSTERQFEDSERDVIAPAWRSGGPVTLEADTLFLCNWLRVWDQVNEWPYTGGEMRRLIEVIPATESLATPPLLASLNRGGLVAHFQGHGNPYLLGHEMWLTDRITTNRFDLASLSNSHGPWFFMGMGCHIADWAQNTVLVTGTGVGLEQSLCEKMLVRSRSGASASYGSSGFEYIDSNRYFGEFIFQRWRSDPPTADVAEQDQRSRWVLGEIMWAADGDLLANFSGTRYREMVAQYTYLGDPLMVVDAGPPEVTAIHEGSGTTITGDYDLQATEATNLEVINLDALDEAGINRIRVMDSLGTDLTNAVVTESLPDGATNHQIVHYRLELPVRPFAHTITASVWDAAGTLDSDLHYELLLNVVHDAEMFADDESFEEGAYDFEPGVSVPFRFEIDSSTWLTEDMPMTVTGDNLAVRDVEFDLSRGNQMTVTFTGVALEGSSGDRSVVVDIAGFATTYLLEGDDVGGGQPTITSAINFPNPMVTNTQFLFESGASGCHGRIRVFSTAGRQVANIEFNYEGGGAGLVDWDGRDNEGDNLANGVYLYRIELETDEGQIASDMQRLVVMQ